MIGNSNGMTIAWKQLILQHCAERQKPFNEFHSVWCFARRLNLVTKELFECERLNVVKAFSDWFSDRRRQVHFKAFLSQKNVQQKLKFIPQPSNTRWLFYRDVITSILSQDTFVEAFIKEYDGFGTFWNSLVDDEEKYCLPVDQKFSIFDDKFRSLFLFAKSVLEILGKVNQVFQGRYLMILDGSCIVNSLKRHIFNLMTDIQQSFSFLDNLGPDMICECEPFIQHLLQSLSLRFTCPSSSHDMRRMRSSIAVWFDEDPVQHNPFHHHCSVARTLVILAFSPTMNGNYMNPPTTHPELNDEIARLRVEALQRREEVGQLMGEKAEL